MVHGRLATASHGGRARTWVDWGVLVRRFSWLVVGVTVALLAGFGCRSPLATDDTDDESDGTDEVDHRGAVLRAELT